MPTRHREPTFRSAPPGRTTTATDFVGPVLSAGAVADAVIAAIQDLNDETLVVDRGSYVRILVPGRCVLTRAAVEEHLGRPFRFPQDLELVMSALRGSLVIDADRALWQASPRGPDPTAEDGE